MSWLANRALDCEIAEFRLYQQHQVVGICQPQDLVCGDQDQLATLRQGHRNGVMRRRQIGGITSDAQGRHQDAEVQSTVRKLGQEPCDFDAADSARPVLGFYQDDVGQEPQALIEKRDVDFLGIKLILLVTMGDRDAGNEAEQVADYSPVGK